MTSRRQEINAGLDAIYARLPEIACRGLCHDECTAIIMTPAERQRIRLASGIRIPDKMMDGPDAPGDALIQLVRARAPGCMTGEDYRCPALTAENQCAVYAVRPLICRAYGLTKRMRCRFGCRPSRWLPEDEWTDLYRQAIEIGGLPDVFAQAGARAVP